MAEAIHRRYVLPMQAAAFLEVVRSRANVERRCQAEGLGTATLVDHEAHPDGVRIEVSSEIPTSWLPSIVTSRLSGTPHVVRVEQWTTATPPEEGLECPMTFSFEGLPVRCDGAAAVVSDGDGSVFTIDLELQVDVPFIGGTIERAVAPQVTPALDAEAAFYQSL